MRKPYKLHRTTSEHETLLHNDKAVSVHMKNLQLLMIEVYKTKSNLNPSFMKEIFIKKNTTYQLRNEYSLLPPPQG